MTVFKGSFTQQEPIPEAAIEAAVSVMRSGRLHRYNSGPNDLSEASRLEAEYAAYQGARYCLACASGGAAMAFALRAAGVAAGTPVLTNAFTLAPVPGAIMAAGGHPVFVETTDELVINLDDLAKKAAETASTVLLLSHMRGHIVDMDALMDVVDAYGLTLIEDCAHTMGATWGGKKSGNFGLAGCFSTQTYKHMNSGEGGFLTSDDASFMARAIVLSGSYMLYERHGAAPPAEAFADVRLETPNMSARMDNVRAAILRPQLSTLDRAVERWNARYRVVEEELSGTAGIALTTRPQTEGFVGSSFQFMLPGIGDDDAIGFVRACAARGVELKWFGAPEPLGFTSSHTSWRYVARQSLPQTDRVLAGLFDLRLPLTFSLADCKLIAAIIREEVETVVSPVE